MGLTQGRANQEGVSEEIIVKLTRRIKGVILSGLMRDKSGQEN